MAEQGTYGQAARSDTGDGEGSATHAHLSTDNSNAVEADRPEIEADSASGDSAYGESTTSSFLTSIASEVTKGLYENGRRYAHESSWCHT